MNQQYSVSNVEIQEYSGDAKWSGFRFRSQAPQRALMCLERGLYQLSSSISRWSRLELTQCLFAFQNRVLFVYSST